jgi:hypothetical protein
MRRSLLPHAVALLILAGSVGAWIATGGEAFTRWPNARLEAADAPVSASEAALLDEIGITSPSDAAVPTIESRFALGLLPSGIDPRHLASVLVGAIVALAVSAMAALRARRRLLCHISAPRT